VYGTDPQGRTHLLSDNDAKAEGMQHVTQASEKDYNDAKGHTVVLNDMQSKLNDVVASRKALDQNPTQRTIIAKALAHLGPATTIGTLTDAGFLSGSTPETQEYIQSVLSLRESALALPKELTNGSRVSEIQASALWATLPSGASLNGNYALKQGQKFQGNIDRMRERNPDVRGMNVVEEHPDLASRSGPVTPPAGKATVYDPNGVPHFINAPTLTQFLSDPQYKGWSQNAPGSAATAAAAKR
jgi:hypothetical protein